MPTRDWMKTGLIAVSLCMLTACSSRLPARRLATLIAGSEGFSQQ
jgi:hypothetical protein